MCVSLFREYPCGGLDEELHTVVGNRVTTEGPEDAEYRCHSITSVIRCAHPGACGDENNPIHLTSMTDAICMEYDRACPECLGNEPDAPQHDVFSEGVTFRRVLATERISMVEDLAERRRLNLLQLEKADVYFGGLMRLFVVLLAQAPTIDADEYAQEWLRWVWREQFCKADPDHVAHMSVYCNWRCIPGQHPYVTNVATSHRKFESSLAGECDAFRNAIESNVQIADGHTHWTMTEEYRTLFEDDWTDSFHFPTNPAVWHYTSDEEMDDLWQNAEAYLFSVRGTLLGLGGTTASMRGRDDTGWDEKIQLRSTLVKVCLRLVTSDPGLDRDVQQRVVMKLCNLLNPWPTSVARVACPSYAGLSLLAPDHELRSMQDLVLFLENNFPDGTMNRERLRFAQKGFETSTETFRRNRNILWRNAVQKIPLADSTISTIRVSLNMVAEKESQSVLERLSADHTGRIDPEERQRLVDEARNPSCQICAERLTDYDFDPLHAPVEMPCCRGVACSQCIRTQILLIPVPRPEAPEPGTGNTNSHICPFCNATDLTWIPADQREELEFLNPQANDGLVSGFTFVMQMNDDNMRWVLEREQQKLGGQ